MIEIQCSCGAQFDVLNEKAAAHTRCPKCGAPASDLIAQAKPSQESFVVACANHPGARATQNCLNCGRPLCMDCVRANGYFCSATCREAVRAAEPSVATGAETGALDEKVGRTMEIIVGLVKKLALLAVVAGLGGAGYFIYQKKFGPRPQVTGRFEVVAPPGAFAVKWLPPDVAVVQTEDELFAANMTTEQKLWSVNLQSFEPQQEDAGETHAFHHDRLQLLEANAGTIVLSSQRLLLALDAKTGALRWKFSEPDTTLSVIAAHAGGMVCALSKRGSPARLINFGLADGAQTLLASPPSNIAAQIVTPANTLALLALEPQKPSAQPQADPDVPTASGFPAQQFQSSLYRSIQRALAEGNLDAFDEPVAERPAQPPKRYTLRFQSLTGGAPSEASVELAGAPHFVAVADLVFLAGGRDLLAFESGPQPVWKASLPAPFARIDGNGGVIAVACGDSVVALDAKSGQQRWMRDGLKARRLAVGPDGAVYATLEIPAKQAKTGEAKDYRWADVSEGRRLDPRAPVTVLLKLDRQTGRTRWGVKNIGQHVRFEGDTMFAFDSVDVTDFLAAASPFVNYFSVRSLAPRTGKDVWAYTRTGSLAQHDAHAGNAFVVFTEGTGLGTRDRPLAAFQLQIVERK
jgi:outer membrane protein assembly factor BamB